MGEGGHLPLHLLEINSGKFENIRANAKLLYGENLILERPP